MILPSPREIARSIGAVMALARGDKTAVARLDLTFSGFWRSFGAAIVVAPLALLFTYAERLMWPEVRPRAPLPPPVLHYVAELVAFAAYWEALPIVMIFMTRALGLTRRFVPFVVAWNWSNVVTALLLTPPILLFLVGGASTQGALVVGTASTLLSVAFQARVTEATLGTGVLASLGISILNLVIGLALSAIADLVPVLLSPHHA
jgi:hypothetical protein